MYHIDLTNLGSNSIEEIERKTSEQDSNHLFESLIIKKIQQNHSNKSHCFLCNSHIEVQTSYDKRNIVEANCNGLLGCHFCEIHNDLTTQIYPGDYILVKYEENTEIAQVRLIGEIVRIKRYAMGLYGELLPTIIRKANDEDIEKVRKNYSDEERAVRVFRNAMEKHKLIMKLVSIHYQFDRKKMYFFYTADGRIDFRELAKDLAAEFKTRIELRQIGVRDEAKKVGGMGTCGREYCCQAFLSSFKRITTQLANDQNLISNMGKLSGPCGKLKCCLSFEVE